MKKRFSNQKLILLMLALFSISIGLWGNFRQLWLLDNSLTPAVIARTISYASILAALYLIYYTNVVSINRIRIGVIVTFILKLIMSILLSVFNGCGNIVLIKFLFFVDIACENIILSSIYPLIVSYQKSDELYGKKSVTEYSFKTVGILLGSIIFGRVFLGNIINYNDCLVISIIFLVSAFIVILFVSDKDKNDIKGSSNCVFKYLLSNKVCKTFLSYTFFANLSYNIGMGLNMLVITNYIGFTVSHATRYILFFSILASLFGWLALKLLRSKNDYINISIKFLVRFILFMVVFFTNDTKFLIIAISYLLITSVAYDYVIGGFVYNNVEEKYMLNFTVIHYILNLLGESIGVFIAGLMYNFGFRYIYLASALFMIIQLIFAYYIVYIKRNNKIN